MAGIIAALLTVLQKIICGGSSVEPEPQYNLQQGQYQPPPPIRPPQGPPSYGPPPGQAHQQQGHGHGHGHGNGAHNGQHQAQQQNNWQQHPEQAGSSPPHQQHHGYQNANLQNQNNAHYRSLRDRAREEGDSMRRYFDQSHQAYENGDGARAHELSEEGHRHQREMERLDQEANDWIFRENNTDSKPGEIDLHGLYVKEAIARTDQAIQEAQARGDTTIHLIVGKGLHSQNHVAKLKPAIEDLMQKHNLSAHLDPHNDGVLIVNLGGGHDRGMDSDEMTRRLEKDEGCSIM